MFNKINRTSPKYSYLTPDNRRMTTFKGDQEKLDLFIKKFEEQNHTAFSSKVSVTEEHHILFFSELELIPA